MKLKNKFTISFIILLAVFFIAQLFTLGSFKNSGKSFEYASGKTVVYAVDLKSGEKLDDLYIKVGSIYTDYGKPASITLKTSTSSSSTATPTTSFASLTLSNVYGAEGRVGANYNWIAVATNKGVSSVRKLSFSATVNLELIEIVAFSDKGNPIGLSVADNSDFNEKSVLKSLDAQDSFVWNNSAKYNFTQEEGYSMTAVHTLLSGNKVIEGSKYNVNGDFGLLPTLLTAPFVALFGETTFALRLPSLLATTLSLAFLGLLGTAIFKDEKYGFLLALVFALGGVATSVGRLGAPYALLTAFLLGSVYFMHRFYSKGLSRRSLKGGWNILLSGLFASLALVSDWTSVFAIAGILVLFGFGLRRQRLSYQLALQATEGKEELKGPEDGLELSVNAEKNKVKKDYEYKLRVSLGFAVIGFVVCAFLLLLFSSVCAYGALVKIYDTPADPKRSILALMFKDFANSGFAVNATQFTQANALTPFSWFLPLKSATLYTGLLEVGSSSYLSWQAVANPVLSVVSLVSLVLATLKIILDFIKKRSDKASLRVRRAYFILLGGLVAALCSALVRGNANAGTSLMFQAFYLGFIPLALLALKGYERSKVSPSEFVVWGVIGVSAVVFALSLPCLYGYAVSAQTAKIFSWTSILSNGYFRK